MGFGPFKFDDEHSIFDIPFVGELHGKPAEWKTKISNGKMGPVELELLEPTEGAQALRETLDAQGEGLHHIGWLTTDVQGRDRAGHGPRRQGVDQLLPRGQSRLLLLRGLRLSGTSPSNCGSRRR